MEQYSNEIDFNEWVYGTLEMGQFIDSNQMTYLNTSQTDWLTEVNTSRLCFASDSLLNWLIDLEIMLLN